MRALQWLPLKGLQKVTHADPFKAMMEIARITYPTQGID